MDTHHTRGRVCACVCVCVFVCACVRTRYHSYTLIALTYSRHLPKGAGRRRVVPMSTLVDELLAALQESVGWPAYRAIRSFWPLYVDLDFEARMRGRT